MVKKFIAEHSWQIASTVCIAAGTVFGAVGTFKDLASAMAKTNEASLAAIIASEVAKQMHK